jgi:hypothetical protein
MLVVNPSLMAPPTYWNCSLHCLRPRNPEPARPSVRLAARVAELVEKSRAGELSPRDASSCDWVPPASLSIAGFRNDSAGGTRC